MKRDNHLRGLLIVALVASACGQGGDMDAEQAPPPAAALLPSDALTLDQKLAELDQDLGFILDRELDGESRTRVYRAEAVTDRLLEDEPPFAWLDSGYDVEARLRQIQALADRVVAQMRRDVDPSLILEDVASLRYAVRDLQTRMEERGGGPQPPSLDSLLAASAEDGAGRGPGAARAAASDTTVTTTNGQPAPPARRPGGLLGDPLP